MHSRRSRQKNENFPLGVSEPRSGERLHAIGFSSSNSV
jgi:hypothetical protein